MINLDKIGEELFSKIRGRFPSVTIGDESGTITNEPKAARFFDFDYKSGSNVLGKVSVSLSEDDGVVVMYSNDFLAKESQLKQEGWYDFLKELRFFAKKRLLNFDTRDINKSNLNKRDYQFLAANRTEEEKMTESKLYGTSRVSYQNIDNARLVIKHTENINQESATGRTQKVGRIYIESAEGEKFIYPYKHLSGARAMARHVSEGGKPYDDFGKHITGLSEELAKLRKFKSYMGRSAVMAESLADYMDVVKERIATVKKTVESLQKASYYKEAFEGFEAPMLEDVPDDVRENWIDQLTIKQFNEELQDVFPYIYKLVSEATRAKELGPDDLVDEGERHGNDSMYDKCWDGYKKVPGKKRGEKGSCVKEDDELEQGFEEMMGQFAEEETDEGNAYAHAVRKAKMDGKKKGDEIDGPDGEKIKIEKEPNDDDTIDVKMTPDGGIEKADAKEEKTPLGEFILSYYDREVGEFPKGETAILTMVEKDYGEEFIEPAKAFIEKINQTFEEYQMRTQPQQMETDSEYNRMRELAGLR